MKLTQDEIRILNNSSITIDIAVRTDDQEFIVKTYDGEGVLQLLETNSLAEARNVRQITEVGELFSISDQEGTAKLEKYALGECVLDISSFPALAQSRQAMIHKVKEGIQHYLFEQAEWERIETDGPEVIREPAGPENNSVYTKHIWHLLNNTQQTNIEKLRASSEEAAKARLYKIALTSNIMQRAFETENAEIPEYLLTKEIMGRPGYAPVGRRTAIHVAAVSGALPKIPASLLNDQELLTTDFGSGSVILTAIRSGTIQELPKAAVKEAVLYNDTEGEILKALSDAKLLKQYLYHNQLAIVDANGRTPIHRAAKHEGSTTSPFGISKCHLENLPGYPNCLTIGTMTKQDINGSTPLHEAAKTKNGLEQVPTKLLTKESLTVKDRNGTTPMHIICAATWGGIPLAKNLPNPLFCEETLFIKNNEGTTPIAALITQRGLALIPSGLITIENLTRDIGGITIGGNTTVTAIHTLAGLNRTDELLGMDIPEKFKDVVGEEWYNKNLQLLQEKNKLQQVEATNEIDIF